MHPSSDYVEEPNDNIHVKCLGGPNLDDLSAAQATFVSHALQSTSSTVYEEAAAADSSDLEDVFYR